ncbi:uncharacterized protein LOC133180263 isoform X2 [Saccostrea echinata]|uniref:uncharacterized protein LOC133180263 isoform X2 n=1 Tax=Saccostrea echinata TaxID=191078 RepID=UPI002A820F43|nr:uncharacterized protein LOC133180263 isoform X2 [Saccostrea echinata]
MNKRKSYFQVVSRLGKGQLDGELDMLKTKKLDHSTGKNITLESMALKERLDILEVKFDDHIPKNLREQFEIELGRWREDDKLFYKFFAYASIREQINSKSYLTVTGGSGAGKTYLIRHLALNLAQEGFEVIPSSSIDEVLQCGKVNTKQVFVMDDVLGVHGLDINLYNNVTAKQDRVFNLLNSGSKLLMSCRSVVFKEAISLNSFITDNDHVVNLSHKDYQLNENDRKSILENHCRYRTVTKECYENLTLSHPLSMFPLLCRVFSSDPKYQKEGEHFFNQPYECFFSELDKMQRIKEIHYAVLVYCVMKNNCISPTTLDKKCLEEIYECCGINASTSKWKIRDILDVLEGSFLTKDTEGRFSIIHEKLCEIVALHFGKHFPYCLFQNAKLGFIYRFISFSDDAEYKIVVSPDRFPALISRVISDIRRFHLYEVFSSDIWKHTSFVEMFCDTLKKFTLDEIKELLSIEENCTYLEDKTRMFLEDTLKRDSEMAKNAIAFPLEYKFFLLQNSSRVLHWIIVFGHGNFLFKITEILKARLPDQSRSFLSNFKRKLKMLSSDKDASDDENLSSVLYGNDLDSQTRCLLLACFSGCVEMVQLVIQFVEPGCVNHYVEYFTPLIVASLSGYDETVIVLLEKGAYVNQCAGKTNISPLMWSCTFGHYKVSQTLVSHDANINHCDKDGRTSLYCASCFGHLEIVKYLVNSGADVNLSDKDGVSPLYTASGNGKVAIVEYLIEAGAKVNLCNRYGKSPLYKASGNGKLDIVKYLVKVGAKVNLCDEEGRSPLYEASAYGQIETVKYLITAGAEVNLCDEDGRSPLYKASGNGRLDIVKYLIKVGAKVNHCNEDGKSPLYEASAYGQIETVRYLITAGAEVNLCDEDGRSPLYKASSKGKLEVVKHLLESGAKINFCKKDRKSPLLVASIYGDLETVKYLIKNGAEVNFCREGGWSPLIAASGQGHLEIVKYLIQNGADINTSCLSSACHGGHMNIVEYLVNKVDVNAVTAGQYSPLRKASRRGHLDIVKYLVEHGAKVNFIESTSKSPLYSAVEYDQMQIVEYLIEQGAKVNQSVIEISKQRGRKEMADYLIEKASRQEEN